MTTEKTGTEERAAGKSGRLACIDALRGFDMFMLLMGIGLTLAVLKVFPVAPWLEAQFKHCIWNGFTFEDLIMPLFLFVSGLSMPFALAKYAGNVPVQLKRIAKRVLVLWFWGMAVQGLLRLDPARLYPWGNTLHAILAGYLIAYLPVLYHWSWKRMTALIVGLLALYTVCMECFTINGCGAGDWSPLGNFAQGFEHLLGRFHREAVAQPDGTVVFAKTYYNCWLFPILSFGATVLFGALAGQILKSGQSKKRIFFTLAGMAAGCIAFGWILDAAGIPVNKPIFTPSYVFVACGWSLGLLALLYAYCDIGGYYRGCGFLSLFGRNTLLCYLLHTMIHFEGAIAAPLVGGFEQYLSPEVYGLLFMVLPGFACDFLHRIA